VASWVLSIFSNETEELLYEMPVPAVDPAKVRELWCTPRSAPIGALPITETERGFLNAHLDEPFVLREEEPAFLELVQGYPGETTPEEDGTVWYPPPG
jgi:hypothetical protein